MLFNLSHKELKQSEKKVFSQSGQDGVLMAIFNQIGHGGKVFVEFGARDGQDLSNTANLRINYGWKGLLMDSEPLSDIVYKETVTKQNINYLLSEYGIKEIDLLCIDIDGNDYWVWGGMYKKSRVVVIEYNSKFSNNESLAIEYNPEHKWDGDDYYSASLLALQKLGEKRGYTLVYVVSELDAIFIKNELLHPEYIPPTLDELFPEPIIAHSSISNKKWVEV